MHWLASSPRRPFLPASNSRLSVCFVCSGNLADFFLTRTAHVFPQFICLSVHERRCVFTYSHHSVNQLWSHDLYLFCLYVIVNPVTKFNYLCRINTNFKHDLLHRQTFIADGAITCTRPANCFDVAIIMSTLRAVAPCHTHTASLKWSSAGSRSNLLSLLTLVRVE